MGALVCVDGCQGIVHGGADVAALGYDFYAFSGHKLYGPTGIGVLYGRRELLDAMPPFLYGGDMVDRVSFGGTTYAPLPLKFEAGTANFVGAIGLGEAIRYLEQFDPAEIEAYERELLGYAAERLSAVDGLRIYGATPDKCAIVSFTVEGTHPYDVGMILDKLGIAVRTGQLARTGDDPLRGAGHVPGVACDVQHARGDRCACSRRRTCREDVALSAKEPFR